ncbi:hypothetical protein Lal_00029075 [Lupinus albus]|nr:hypothetical protein Lal_00029075 [Lupinus albus]
MGFNRVIENTKERYFSLLVLRSLAEKRREEEESASSIRNLSFIHSKIVLIRRNNHFQVCISYAYLSLDSASQRRISFTLAALTNSNYSRTSRRVWGDNEAGVILLCVLQRSRSSDIWRLCRVSVGLSLDYG